MLTCHLSDNSSNKSRITKQHNKKHDGRQIFMDNTKILHHINYAKDLRMLETLSIKNKETSINKILLISETNIINALNYKKKKKYPKLINNSEIFETNMQNNV